RPPAAPGHRQRPDLRRRRPAAAAGDAGGVARARLPAVSRSLAEAPARRPALRLPRHPRPAGPTDAPRRRTAHRQRRPRPDRVDPAPGAHASRLRVARDQPRRLAKPAARPGRDALREEGDCRWPPARLSAVSPPRAGLRFILQAAAKYLYSP